MPDSTEVDQLPSKEKVQHTLKAIAYMIDQLYDGIDHCSVALIIRAVDNKPNKDGDEVAQLESMLRGSQDEILSMMVSTIRTITSSDDSNDHMEIFDTKDDKASN